MVLGGPALNDIELIICSKRSFTGSQLICSNSFRPICALLFKPDKTVYIYLGVFAILTLIFCLSEGTKLNKRDQNGALLESYKAIYEEAAGA